jgi:peptide deformylase
MIQKVLQSKDPVLRKTAKAVIKVDKKVLGVIRDLKDTLMVQKEPEGVGLAAPQIGKSLRIFIADYKPSVPSAGKNFQRVVINPEILEIIKTKKKPHSVKAPRGKEILEGCLSLPYYYGPLKRADKVTVKYLNEKGEDVVETFEDFEAQIILHEIDHLNGILFVDHILEEKKPLYKVEGDEWEEVELV